MSIQIKRNPDGTWALYVNQHCEIPADSYSFVSAVEHALKYPTQFPIPLTEAEELAESIAHAWTSRRPLPGRA